MIDLQEAYDVLMAHVKAGPTVSLPLPEALFRTLAESVRCDLDHPPFDRSVMDGYAVRSADVANVPVRLALVDQVAAGHVPRRPLAAGEAIQINTGAPIPIGADAVVRVEETEPASDGASILVKGSVPAGHFITRQAAYASAGAIILERGTRLNPLALAGCAACGAAEVRVYRQPTVAILSTGDELIEIDRVPAGAQIRNSNQCLLDALVRSVGCKPVPRGIACDDRDVLKDRITQGLKADVLCLTGGVSMGAFDFVPAVLEDCGVTIHIRKMNIKPGRPIHFGTTASGTLIFGLPGNPASAFVGFELLVRPALAALEGRPGEFPRPIEAVLCGSVGATRDRRTFIPAYARIDDHGAWTVEPLSWGGSGDALGMATAGALIVRPPHAPALETGAQVRAYLLDRR